MDPIGLVSVRSAIDAAATRTGVSVDTITLVVVSKGRSNQDVASVVRSGQLVLGENRQQGLQDRVASGLFDEVEWHFIGPLQSRKVAFVQEHAALLHSMDRLSLAQRWVNAGATPVSAGATPVLMQFNLGNEPQKSGFDPSDSDTVIEQLLELGVDVAGVMAIPPVAPDPEQTRPYFAQLRAIFDHYRGSYANMEHCSMGMSHDFEVAIEEGSTMVRVGRAIFEPTGR
ncbi:MAG: YggS family pyridoxal phosphate-dependent enzyme [Acidimicrobiia bacterium]